MKTLAKLWLWCIVLALVAGDTRLCYVDRDMLIFQSLFFGIVILVPITVWAMIEIGWIK